MNKEIQSDDLTEDETKIFERKIMRNTVCKLYFRGRSEDFCSDCEDKVACIKLIQDALDFINFLK